MLRNNSDNADVKLIDFGLATETSGCDIMDAVGTPQYVAPEVIDCAKYKLAYGKFAESWLVS